MNRKVLTTLIAIVLIGGIAFTGVRLVLAETSGSSPDSGATSRVKTAYDSLVSLSHGSDAAGAWGDWGAKWNRLRSAADFAPSGDTGVTDVKNTKTFNSNSRTGSTGTYPNPTNCSTMQYLDNHASANPTDNCSLTWETASPAVTGDDLKDPRTGLVWSQPLKNEGGTVTFAPNGYSVWIWDSTSVRFTVTAANATVGAVYSNNGSLFTVAATIVASTGLTTTADGPPSVSGTLTKVSGTGDATITFSTANGGYNNTIVGMKTATQLCSERGNGWRLPTQKEMIQGWIDGSYYNLVGAATVNWTSTKFNDTNSFYMTLSTGAQYYQTLNQDAHVRCVR